MTRLMIAGFLIFVGTGWIVAKTFGDLGLAALVMIAAIGINIIDMGRKR